VTGQLPFLEVGELRKQDESVVAAEVPVSIWPAGNLVSSVGYHYDHTAEAAPEHYDELRRPNRTLVVGGAHYKVMNATLNPLGAPPHVALRLRSGGS
jgi:hypothetical protein